MKNFIEVLTILGMFIGAWMIIFFVHSLLPNPNTWNMGVM